MRRNPDCRRRRGRRQRRLARDGTRPGRGGPAGARPSRLRHDLAFRRQHHLEAGAGQRRSHRVRARPPASSRAGVRAIHRMAAHRPALHRSKRRVAAHSRAPRAGGGGTRLRRRPARAGGSAPASSARRSGRHRRRLAQSALGPGQPRRSSGRLCPRGTPPRRPCRRAVHGPRARAAQWPGAWGGHRPRSLRSGRGGGRGRPLDPAAPRRRGHRRRPRCVRALLRDRAARARARARDALLHLRRRPHLRARGGRRLPGGFLRPGCKVSRRGHPAGALRLHPPG